MSEAVHAFRLRRSEAAATVLLPSFLGRVSEFLKAYEPITDIELVIDSIWKDYGSGEEDWLLVAMVQPEVGLVGHLLAGVFQYYGETNAIVYQFAHDHEVGDAWGAALSADEILCAWAERKGCGSVSCLPRSKSRARLYRKAGYQNREPRMTKAVLRRK